LEGVRRMKKAFTVIMIVISIILALALYSILNQQKSTKTPELNEIFRRTGDLIVQKYSYKFVVSTGEKSRLNESRVLYRVVAESYVHLDTNQIKLEEKEDGTIYVKLPQLSADEPIIDERNIQLIGAKYGWFTFNDERIDNIAREEIRRKAEEILQQLRAENYLNEIATAENVVEAVLKKFYPDKEFVFESN
jgi:hypothetical protein